MSEKEGIFMGRKKQQFIALLSAAGLLLTMAACGASGKEPVQTGGETEGKETQAAQTAETDMEKDASGGQEVTLDILAKNVGESFNQYADNHVQDKMAEDIGVRIHMVNADNDKFNVLLAGGDLPDLVRTGPDNFEQLVAGKNVLPLDDYLEEYGKDILANAPDTVAFSRKYWSNGENKLYFLPVQVGPDTAEIEHAIGPVVRWDYYKELGYPETNNIDEYLQMLKEMQDAHPTTEDGKKVYAISMFADWGNWYLVQPMSAFMGYNSISGSTLGQYHVDTNEFALSLDEGGLYWDSIDYYYKANQLGILDPDTLTQKYEDLQAKITAGQVLTAPATWGAGSFNKDHAGTTQGFMALPMKWGNQWYGMDYKVGWIDKSIGISSTCKYPEAAVAFLNYCYSYDGARTLYSGVEGVDWDLVDGKPVMKQETLDLQKAGGEAWQESGIGFDVNFMGLGQNVIDPEDGKPVNLFRDETMYPSMLNELQKEYCDHYKVSYPSEIFEQYREKYGVYDQSKANSLLLALVPTPPDDIKRMEAKLDEASLKAAAKMILAGSDEELADLKTKTMEEFRSLGIDKVHDWYANEWDQAKEKVKKME